MAAILSLDPIIRTTNGKVRGRQRKTVYDDNFYCFDGIPYAKPPLGELRFKSPQAAEPWQGVLDCTEVKPKCLQWNRYTKQIEGSEDCLYLNVYVKSSPKPLPVLVYIHGGMFTTGDASRNAWGPDYFMMKDVILVTIGHRLGPLGFLSLKNPELKVPGNAGTKDQVAALQWIRANIAYFNGDPQNITLFGHSSGSCFTELLMLNPHCIGLFHKAVLMSGFYHNFHHLDDMAYRLAAFAGFVGDKKDENAILSFLANIEPSKLLNADLLTREEKDMGFHITFQPCVEPYASDDAILLKQPIEMLQNTWSNKIPIMLGCTSQESLVNYKEYMNSKHLYETLRGQPERMLPIDLQLKCDVALQRQFGEQMKQLHYGDKELSADSVFCTIDQRSYHFYHGCHRLLLARRAKRDNARTYLYRFDFDSPTFNLYRIKHCGPDMRGVAHVDELSYIFYMPQSFKLSRDSAEFKTIQRMVGLWTSFACSSNPNGAGIAPIIWEPLERNQMDKPHMCLNISNDLSFIVWPELEKCKVWDYFYQTAGLKLF